MLDFLIDNWEWVVGVEVFGVLFLMRFFRVAHNWDEEIKLMRESRKRRKEDPLSLRHKEM